MSKEQRKGGQFFEKTENTHCCSRRLLRFRLLILFLLDPLSIELRLRLLEMYMHRRGIMKRLTRTPPPPVIPLPLPMPQILPRIKHIHLKIHHLPLRHLDIDQIHGQDLARQVLEIVVRLIGADDDVELAVGRVVDRVHRVVEEVFADVEFVVIVSGRFFGFGAFDPYGVHDVGGCVGHLHDLLDWVPGAAAELGCRWRGNGVS